MELLVINVTLLSMWAIAASNRAIQRKNPTHPARWLGLSIGLMQLTGFVGVYVAQMFDFRFAFSFLLLLTSAFLAVTTLIFVLSYLIISGLR